MAETVLSAEPDTFPRWLLYQAATRPNGVAMREKDLGIWQTWSWARFADEATAMAAGLMASGMKRGDRLAIIGDNRPYLYMAMSAAQMLGGIPVPLYQDAIADEMAFVMDDAAIAIALVEDQEQVDKLLEIRQQLPALAVIAYDDSRGMTDYSDRGLMSIADLIARGREQLAADPGHIEREIALGQSEDISVMLYTSGTTGKPKGVCQTHRAFCAAAQGARSFDKLVAGDEILSYLPMAWVGDHLFSFAQALVVGMTVNCPESAETVLNDMRDIGPTYYFAPPRVFENLLTQVTIRMHDASAWKKQLFSAFMGVARRCGADILDGKPVPWLDRCRYALGELLIYGPLKNTLGMSRIRVAYTAGAAIGPELFRFYRSIGINLKQLYGQTETCAYVCLQPDGDIQYDSVGVAAPGVEIAIADNGEILVKGPMLLKEYYQRPEATLEAMTSDGAFKTGDAGYIDARGHLKIIDRAKDVGKLTSGAVFAPNYLENKLKFFPYIKESVCFGHDRDHVCAFINIDVGAVGNWAERRGLAYSGYTDLAGKAEVRGLIASCIDDVNAALAADAMVAATQIKRFLILHKELDPDDDELTRTRKIRRHFVSEKYKLLIDALYSDKTQQYIETDVKFEDGRQGKVAATLQLVDARVYPLPASAAAATERQS